MCSERKASSCNPPTYPRRRRRSPSGVWLVVLAPACLCMSLFQGFGWDVSHSSNASVVSVVLGWVVNLMQACLILARRVKCYIIACAGYPVSAASLSCTSRHREPGNLVMRPPEWAREADRRLWGGGRGMEAAPWSLSNFSPAIGHESLMDQPSRDRHFETVTYLSHFPYYVLFRRIAALLRVAIKVYISPCPLLLPGETNGFLTAWLSLDCMKQAASRRACQQPSPEFQSPVPQHHGPSGGYHQAVADF
ncbi:hypothetical protein B0H66DRAFT_266702 [Apodospora peruviana]|uniref:Uncharacterized protein n=1 Tax=Apodospora peruviana TaxID=516989 RepID=A0AAE0I6A7_9PEZI|nr:hypothetical protein B0H66DRAFT_266702 [Apodospora peruviana]